MSTAMHAQEKVSPAIKPVSLHTQTGLLQRKCACGGSPGVDGECEECREKRLSLQRSATASASPSPAVPPIVHEVLRSPGQSLDVGTRAFMEPRFGHDFSHVRVHTDAKGGESARAVNALAYTVGRDVVFGEGRYAPGTGEGKRLMAHELTHVVQQETEVLHKKIEVGSPGDIYEQEADQVSDAIMNNSVLNRDLTIRRWTTLPVVMRTPSESGIKSGDYSYSTNCGWIDWGHANPTTARNMINSVRAASAKLNAAETSRSKQPGIRMTGSGEPGRVGSEKCPSDYDPEEKAASLRPQEPLSERHSFANYDEVYLYGFGVDQSDASHFAGIIGAIVREVSINPGTRVEIYGFTDCLGAEKRNISLRSKRALNIWQMFPQQVRNQTPVITFASPDLYLANNSTSEGRRHNRGVVIKILPPLPPERITGVETSGVPHLPRAGVNGAAIIADILQPLTPDEELQVALGLFVRTSWAFEESQFATDWAVQSSFSEEDLPSNLLGFYRAANGLSNPDVGKICDAWDVSRSLAKYKGYIFVKNRSFFPRELPVGGVWPSQFSKIAEAPPGQLWEVKEVILRVPGFTERKCFNAGANVPCKQ